MAETPEVHPGHGGKIGSFLQQSTAGLPNWAWLLVIAGGITAAIIIPKFFKGGGANPSASGLGLAIDPSTGLPYAIEGLVPSGGIAGNNDNATNTEKKTTTYPITALTRASANGVISIVVKDKPGGKEIRQIPTSSNIKVTGPAIIDANNVQWYPIEGGGYVFGYDLIFNNNDAGSVGPRPIPLWPQHYMRSRHYRYAS
jgi:hypothetical protein